MKLETRSSFGWGPSPAGYANPTQGLVIHYDGSNQGLAGKPHSACRDYWRRTRSFHTGPSRGWADIGYSFGACPHGYVLEGRGLNKQQAAQPGGNSTWYSCTLMGGDSETPTAAQINAVRELRAWLRGKGVGAAVRGHRQFVSTSCPGPIAYRMVQDGTFTGTPQTITSEEDDMEPTTAVKIPDYWKGKNFSHESYTAAFLWAGNLSETRTFGKAILAGNKEILARLDAQAATIDKLVDALGAGQGVDLEALKQEIREAIGSIQVRLDVDDAEPASEPTQG